MKRFLFLLTTLPILAFGQFTDDFTDGDFTALPAWAGDTAKFEVDTNLELHLNDAPVTSTAVLSTSSSAVFDASWSFKVRMDFAPSGSNYTNVYLVADAANFNGALNGYYVRIGGQSGSTDDVSLYEQSGTSSTKIIDGVDGTVASNPTVSVLVTVDSFGLWELSIDTSSASTGFVSQGTVVDTTHQFSAFSGVYCKYTSTRSTLFWFDDFNVSGSSLPDLAAPTVISTHVLSATSLQVDFNEPLDQSTAETPANYVADNGLGQPQTAILTNGDSSVVLSWISNFSIGVDYNLTINNVEDLNGNALSNEVTNFIYLNFGTPNYRDIVINEIFPHPTPTVALPPLEFVEIYNPTNQYFDLNGLEVSDASSSGFVANAPVYFIAPGEYIILCDEDDTAAFFGYGKVIPLSSLPQLNNSGDDVRISINGATIDFVQYTDDWYQDSEKSSGGYSLEQINPETPCTGESNWRASNSSSGGTPGIQNSVYNLAPDTTSPNIVRSEILSLTSIEIVFDKSLDSTALTSTNWAFSPSLGVDSVVFHSNYSTGIIYLSTALDSATLYTLTINGAADCNGNTLVNNTLSLRIGQLPSTYDLVFTEVFIAPSEDAQIPAVEFIEIYNRTNGLIRIENATISDASTSTGLEDAIMLPHSYAIICDDANAALFEDSITVIEASSLPSFNNSSDELTLTVNSTTIDYLAYSDDWYQSTDPCCTTLEKINPDFVCGSATNWNPSENNLGGTPGYVNSINDSTTSTKVEFQSFQLIGDKQTAQVFFSGLIDTNTFGGSVFADQIAFDVIGLESNSSQVDLFTASVLQGGETYSIEVSGFKDCQGNLIGASSQTYYLHTAGDILLNEVLFNPTSTGADFVEIKSNSSEPIQLSGWSFAYYNSDDSLVLNPISSFNHLVEPAAILAFTEDKEAVISDYPRAQEANIFIGELPTYANTEGSVLLYDQFGEEIDRFDYSEEYHFELIDNPDGVSLERISLDIETNQSSNWHSASSTEGYATPGYENSQFLEAFNANQTIELTSEYVSPDNDGYQDVVGIHYKLAEPGYSAVVKAFDHRGFEVKTIVNNQLLGAEGTIFWDGTNNNNEKAQIGIHVIHVLLFDLEGNQLEYKLPVVVAGRF